MSETNQHLSAVFENRETVLEVLHNLQQAGIESVSVHAHDPLEEKTDDGSLRTYNGSSVQALRTHTPTEANEGLDPISLSLPASQRPVVPTRGADRIEDATSFTGLYRDPLTGISSETEFDRQLLSSFHHLLEYKGLSHGQAQQYEHSDAAHHYLLIVDDLNTTERMQRAESIIQQDHPTLSHRF